jgi:hypothetical protein
MAEMQILPQNQGMMSLPLLAVLTVFQRQALQLAYPDKPDL